MSVYDRDDVKIYLVESIRKILKDERIMNALPGQLYFDGADERMEIIIAKMSAIANSAP